LHLLIDGYGGDKAKLANESILYQLLRDLPRTMGMKTISHPYVQHYGGGAKPEDGGLSAFILIAESHLSFHTFPERGFVWADLFSCKEFDAEPVLRMIRLAFGLQYARALVVDRGLECTDPTADWGLVSRRLGRPPGAEGDGQFRFPVAVPSTPSQAQ
jgi:S-adenosylmethionine decarboxylase